MTVRELIAELEKLDGDLEVIVWDAYDDAARDPEMGLDELHPGVLKL